MTRRALNIARHEAAHAVVGVYLGLTLRVVKLGGTTCDDQGWEGYTHFRYSPAKRLAFGAMCAAGAAGDVIHGFPASHERAPTRWSGDVALAEAHGFTPREIIMLRDLATFYLRGPCARPWRRVTAALLERDLSGPEIKRLMLHGEPIEL